MHRWWKAGIALMVLAGCAPAPGGGHGMDRWAVYYDKKAPAEEFEDYDLVVFDRVYHPDLKPLKGEVVLLAYISLGQVHAGSKDEALLREEGLITGDKDKVWGSYPVDVTSATWRSMIHDKAKDAMEQGFDGVMFDTLDTPLWNATRKSPEMAEATRKAIVNIIAGVKQANPGIKIMVNRGFSALPLLAPHIDYALGESILVETDVLTGQSKLSAPNSYQLMASKLLAARATNPRLKLYTLDYWNQEDVHGLRNIYAMQRSRGFSPYVSTPDLRRHTPEPRGWFGRFSALARQIVTEDRDA